jgi:hypothetical protein
MNVHYRNYPRQWRLRVIYLMNMGYYTIKLDYDAQKLCIIVTPVGKYQYLRLPMGVSCSPDIFQEKISDVMQHLHFVRTYLDELLFIWCSTKKHLKRFTRKC